MTTWPAAAERIARRVTRRARMTALLRPLGAGLLLGAASALAARLLGWSPGAWGGVLAALTAAGFLWGLGRARAVSPIAPAHAAWALDRLSGAGDRGLVAATASGPAAAEAAWAPPRIEPPPVHLMPPAGLALSLGGVLAVVVAVLVPAGAPPREAPERSRLAAAGSGPAGAEIGREEAEARRDAAAAQAAEAVREALGLGPQAAEDPARLAERLADPAARAEALAAAPEGSEIAEILAGGEEGVDPEALAEALASGVEAERSAREGFRRAAAARALGAGFPIPPERRALLERYFSSPETPR